MDMRDFALDSVGWDYPGDPMGWGLVILLIGLAIFMFLVIRSDRRK